MRKIIEKLMNYIEAEDVKGLVRFCLILSPFVVGVLWAVGALIKYITFHQQALIIVGVAACMIIPALMGKKTTPPPPTVAANDNLLFFDRLLLKGLFTIFTNYSRQFQVIAPLRFSDLQDTLPSGIDQGRNIAIYRFKVVADGEPLSQADFHEILTVHLEERLASGELALGKPTAEFGGKIYPKVYIDECLYAGGVWRITLMVCDNEKVAHYIDHKAQTLLMRNSRISNQYEDNDF